MDLKISHKVTNWKQYNEALRQRGNISVWISDDLFELPQNKKRGRPPIYSVGLIEFALSLRFLFKLPLRATQGLVDSLFGLQGLSNKCCDYTLLCKRSHEVCEKIRDRFKTISSVVHLAVDSTGLKVFGEGEWKARIHGPDKRRTWRKLHLAIDADSQMIVGHTLTENNVTDGQALPKILSGIEAIDQAYGDGAYDQIPCYEEFCKKGARPIIPPRKGSRSDLEVWSFAEQWKGLNVRGCKMIGRASWKVGVGYHRRSLVETAVGRFKKVFTGSLASRKRTNQEAEVEIKVSMLNKLTALGMAKTVTEKRWVA